MIAVIQAHKEGKEIEFFNRMSEKWEDCPDVLFAFNSGKYRIKKILFREEIFLTTMLTANNELALDIPFVKVPKQGKYKVTIEELG